MIDSRGETGIFGAATGVFETTLSGSGRVFATKFWPGAFRPFFGRAVSALSDTWLPAETVFSRTSENLQNEFSGLNDPLVSFTGAAWLYFVAWCHKASVRSLTRDKVFR